MIKYLKTRWKTGVLALLMVAVTAGILFLYDIPLEPVGYVAVFEMLLTGLGLMWDYHKYRKKQESLLYIRDCGNFSEEYLEAPENENEAIYREICRSLDEKRIEAENQRSAFGTELTDFYTLWVHQINPEWIGRRMKRTRSCFASFRWSSLRQSSTWRWCWGIFERRIWLQTSDLRKWIWIL